MAEKMSGPDLWINSKYPKASSRVTFAKWLPCLTSAWRPWVTTEEHCWWPLPLVGLVGAKGSLAPRGDLLEIHFSVWFPAVGPDKPAQSGAALKKMA